MKEVSDDSTAGTASAVSLLARDSMTPACSGFIRITISELRPLSVTDSPFASRALYVASRPAVIFKLAHYRPRIVERYLSLSDLKSASRAVMDWA